MPRAGRESLRGVVYGQPRVTDAEATDLLFAVLGAGGQGWHALTTHERTTAWIAYDDRAKFARMVPEWGFYRDAELGACLLADKGSFRLTARAGCVWARVETGAALSRLRRFRPVPTLVLRDGATVKYTALWALRQPLDPLDAERVGRHLAHKLGAPKKHAADSFRFRPPGAVVRAGRTRPLPIVVAGGSGEPYPVGVVCRTLPREIPDPDAWRK